MSKRSPSFWATIAGHPLAPCPLALVPLAMLSPRTTRRSGGAEGVEVGSRVGVEELPVGEAVPHARRRVTAAQHATTVRKVPKSISLAPYTTRVPFRPLPSGDRKTRDCRRITSDRPPAPAVPPATAFTRGVKLFTE